MMEPTTFAALKAMEARGYIVRRQLADNRRNVHVFLTARGRALERKLVPLALECNAIAVRGVPVDDVAVTRATLLAMLRNDADTFRGFAELDPSSAPGRFYARVVE